MAGKSTGGCKHEFSGKDGLLSAKYWEPLRTLPS